MKIPPEIVEILEDTSIWKCIQCGKCTASCPLGNISRMRIRDMIYRAYEGEDILHLEELWFCTTCYTCTERCPKGVNTVDAVLEFRNEAFKREKYPKIHKTAIKNLYDTGTVFPLSPDTVKYRIMLGLRKEPLDVSASKEELEAFRKLIEKYKIFSLAR